MILASKTGSGRLERAVVVSDRVNDLGDLVVNVAALVHPLGYSAVCIHNCGVVSITEYLPNFRQ